MSIYHHILLAADFSKDSARVEERAKALCQLFDAKLSVAHVQEPISIAYAGEFPVDLGELHTELEKQAKDQLSQLGQRLGVPQQQCFLEIGITEKELLRVAEEQAVDLIIIGSHGRHGLALLLGSTANAVLHHSKIDVLAVRIGN